jgi:hypothetical protein
MIRAYEVRLTIPDNAAFTARATLDRLGLGMEELTRAEIYLFDVDDACVAALDAAVPTIETIYNPNKHVFRIRDAVPEAGELWVGNRPAQGGPSPVPKQEPMQAFRIAGRSLAGVRSLERYVSWRFRRRGAAAPPELVLVAAESLLANAAYQNVTVGA